MAFRTHRTLRALSFALLIAAVIPSFTMLTNGGGVLTVARAEDELSREKLPDTVKLMLKDLSVDAPDWKKFLQDYALDFDKVPPAEVDKTVEFIKTALGSLLIKALKGIDGKEPITVSDTEAKYDVKDIVKDTGMGDDLKFVKKDGKWYMK